MSYTEGLGPATKKHGTVKIGVAKPNSPSPKRSCVSSVVEEPAAKSTSASPIVLVLNGDAPEGSQILPAEANPPVDNPICQTETKEAGARSKIEGRSTSRPIAADASSCNAGSSLTGNARSAVVKHHSGAHPAGTKESPIAVVREAIEKYYKPRLPNRIPRKPTCERAKSHRTQPRWDELPRLQRLRRAHHSLAGLAPQPSDKVHLAFTLNLSHEIEKKAHEQVDPLDWLYRRVNRNLGIMCQLLVMTAEVAPIHNATERMRRAGKGLPVSERLHLHGELVCSRRSSGLIERRRFNRTLNAQESFWSSAGTGDGVFNRLLKAVGTWERPGRQLAFASDPGERWLTKYCIKQGDRFCMSLELRRLAQADYKWSRQAQNDDIKRVLRIKRAKRKLGRR